MTAQRGALPYVYRITKYDPADRDEHGHYAGTEDSVSDHGAVEAAYLQAVAAFAASTGIDHLAIREPGLAPGFAHFGLEPAIDGHGLTGLFPPDLAGFHDGAEVSVETGAELVRAMLRDNGAFCSLEVEDRFFVHIGWDQYMYVGSAEPCDDAVAHTRGLGLFPERLTASPYEDAYDADDAYDEPGVQRPADADFWARLRTSVAYGEAAILEESHLQNVSRWHRLTSRNLDAVRTRLAPRARLAVWPDLSTDVAAALAALPHRDIVEIVWEDGDGRIASTIADDTQFEALTAARLAEARAIAVLPITEDDRQPLFTAVLPDADGVLRARWRTTPTASDRAWALSAASPR